MNFLDKLLDAMGADEGVRHFLQEADRAHRDMLRLRESSDLDIYSPQPAESKSSRAARYLGAGALVGTAGAAGLAGVGAIQGGIDRYNNKMKLRKQRRGFTKELAGFSDKAAPGAEKATKGLADVSQKLKKLPGYVRAVAGGAVKGVTRPLKTLYRGAGLAYLDKHF